MAAGRGPEKTGQAKKIDMLALLAQNGASANTLKLIGRRLRMSGAEHFAAPQPQPQPTEVEAPALGSPRRHSSQE